jgi:AP2 domain
MAKVIELSKGYIALVDDGDFDELNQYKWYLGSSCNGIVYAKRKDGRREVPMHSYITGSKCTDHVTHDLLRFKLIDNRRDNLRAATMGQNAMNRRKRRDTSSKYKGVTWDKAKRMWKAYLTLEGGWYWLGRHSEEKEAALAYDRRAAQVFGRFALTNQMMYPEDFAQE